MITYLLQRVVPGSSPAGASDLPQQQRRTEVRAAQIRLLYDNAATGIVAALIVAAVLAYGQWDVIPHTVIVVWLAYVVLISAARAVLVRRYWRASPTGAENQAWGVAFALGAGLASAGWGAAGIVLFPEGKPTNEILLVFALGGMMLGGASLLAPRPEAFLAFLLPTGLVPAVRLALEGDPEHLTMGLLAGVFTAATVSTTWRFHLTITSSLLLGFENRDLVQGLQIAKDRADALNRELEDRVAERTAKLQEADQRKDEFLSTLAHELRNPLAPIRFALEGLKAGTPPDRSARAHEVIDRQVGLLVRLVDDLLDVSRITANKIHLRRERHSLARLISTAVESIIPLARAAEHELNVELPPASIVVNGDATRLVQVLANVLNNAVKFTPRGGHIWLSVEQRPDEAVLRVRDDGIGIASDVLPRVFDMFRQAEPILERSSGGLGIGLTLARRLVEMHDGRIQIRSGGVGQGSEVEIRLPTVTATTPAGFQAEPPVAAPARTLRVLIVDDNLDAAEMLGMAVSLLGHTTRLAYDGRAAIAQASEFAPDVILLDIGLPGMSGYAVARALREQEAFRHVHIAAVTGWGQEEDRRRARDAGFDSHFTKPLSPGALEDLLDGIARGDAGGTPRTRRTDGDG